MICIVVVERATDGPCGTCGLNATAATHERGDGQGDPFHSWLGLPKWLCLDEEGKLRTEADDTPAHAYLEGEWCPTCGGYGWIVQFYDRPLSRPGSARAVCPTCKGLRAVAVKAMS